jgi:NAD(P)-dependent dehydrogenase (short-subunit alcohol dehydrogenase family)
MEGDKMRLKGKKILITGAASGIGLAGAVLMAREGATVALVDRDDAVIEAARQIAASGATAHAIVADLSGVERSRQAVRDAAIALGGLTCLWCNAGVPGPIDIENIEPAAYEFTVAINQTAVVMMSSAAIPLLRENGGGSIVITSSTSGLVGALSSPSYSASKFAVIGWTKSLAQRVAQDGIRVNAICPGPVLTPMMRHALAEGAGGMSGEEYGKRLVAGVPLGRLADPDEIAQAALWLMSDEASYVTGIALPIDGGHTCR